MHKSGWLIGALLLPLAACSNSDSAAESPAGKSGLSSTLLLSGANDAEKLQFCNWLVSVAPSDACGAPSASSPDGGVAVPPDAGALTAAAYCLATFTGFTNDCSVVAAEQCFSTWEASGACKVPDASACAAYQACSKATPPKNDGPPTALTCGRETAQQETSTYDVYGTIPYHDWCTTTSWLGVESTGPCDYEAARALCNKTFADCWDVCSAGW